MWDRYRQWLWDDRQLGFRLDVSRMDLSEGFLQKMAPRLEQAFEEMARLEEGAIANPDEQRMVGHYWLRAPELTPTPEIRRDIEEKGFAFTRRHWAHGLHSPYWWLQCAMWKSRETNWLIRQYHKLLVWEIMKRPFLTRALSAVADPLMGKSVVLYFDKRAQS